MSGKPNPQEKPRIELQEKIRKRKTVAFISGTRSSFIENDCEILSKTFNVKRIVFRGLKDIPNLFRAILKSDISFSWFAGGHAVFAVLFSKVLRKKSIVVIGGYEPVGMPEIGYGAQLYLRSRARVNFVFKYADVLLAVSSFSKKHIRTVAPSRAPVMIHNAIDCDVFTPGEQDRENMVLTVAHVSDNNVSRKGLDTFIKCAHFLPETRFVVVGPTIGDTASRLKESAPKNVDIIGEVSESELVKYYQCASAYCQLSEYESFGMCVIEAMACGCVPIVSNRGALPEVVGYEGIVVKCGDVGETVSAINKVLDGYTLDPRARTIKHFSHLLRLSKLESVINFNLKDERTLIRMHRSVDMAQVKPYHKVLDLGCGDSSIKNLLPEKIDYTGVDIRMGDITHDLENGIPHELKDTKFDVIFLNEFIEHIENFRSLLIECREILTCGGRIILSTPSSNRIIFGEDRTHIHCFRKTNMRNLMNICGLKIDKVSGTYLGVPFVPIIKSKQTGLTGVVAYKLIKQGGL